MPTNNLPLNEINYQWLSLRAKVNYNNGKIDLSFNATIRIHKDSMLWMSLTGPLGIEGARVLVTPDSIFIHNKLQGEFTQQPLNAYNKFLPVPLTLPLLQDLIAGNMWDYHTAAYKMKDTVDQKLVLVNDDNPTIKTLLYILPQNYTIAKTVWTDLMELRELDINFDNYTPVKNQLFSMNRDLHITQSGLKTDISLGVTKITIDEPLEFPFEIPAKFRK